MIDYSNIKYSGEFLGIARNWIQRFFMEGDTVTWGSHTPMTPKRNLTPYVIETLACDIRDATLKQFKVKDSDHVYKYKILRNGEGRFLQYADTPKEIWAMLFEKAEFVMIGTMSDELVFSGSREDARKFVENMAA